MSLAWEEISHFNPHCYWSFPNCACRSILLGTNQRFLQAVSRRSIYALALDFACEVVLSQFLKLGPKRLARVAWRLRSVSFCQAPRLTVLKNRGRGMQTNCVQRGIYQWNEEVRHACAYRICLLSQIRRAGGTIPGWSLSTYTITHHIITVHTTAIQPQATRNL